MIKIKLIIVSTFLLLTCCRHTSSSPLEVRVRLPQDPENLNPVTYTNTHGLQIINLLFQTLLQPTGTQAQLEPLLAEALPNAQRLDTAVQVSYQLRAVPCCHNGTPITAKDALFLMKLNKCPLLDN